MMSTPVTEYLTLFWFAMFVNEYKLIIYCTFQFKKVRKMQNLGNVYIWGSPFVMSRTNAQTGVEIIFNVLILICVIRSDLIFPSKTELKVIGHQSHQTFCQTTL